MKIEKPLTDKIKEKANMLYEYLKLQDDYVSKEEIGRYLGIKNERSVRDIISLLSLKKPIIAKSNSKGYKLAKSVKDIPDLINTWQELDSRIKQLEMRRETLIKFYEKYREKHYE